MDAIPNFSAQISPTHITILANDPYSYIGNSKPDTTKKTEDRERSEPVFHT